MIGRSACGGIGAALPRLGKGNGEANINMGDMCLTITTEIGFAREKTFACASFWIAGSKTLAQSMFQRWLSPRAEGTSSTDMSSKLRTTTFDDVVDAQSAHYAVAAVVLLSLSKKVQSFHKIVACVIDEKRNRMWCEAIGSQSEMDGLLKILVQGKPVLFSSLCYKRSAWHSGGKFLDLTKKQKVKVEVDRKSVV